MSVEALLELRACLEQDDHDQVCRLCQELLEQHKEEEEDASLCDTLYKVWIEACLNKNDLDKAWELSKHAEMYRPYVLYRRQRYQQAVQQIVGESVFEKHVLAQSRYRLHQTKASLDAYRDILEQADQDAEDRMQTLTNTLAVALSNAPTESKDLEQSSQEMLDAADDRDGYYYPYDLAFNLATYRALHPPFSADAVTSLFDRAKQAVLDQVDDDDMLASELAPIETNKAWFQQEPLVERQDLPEAMRFVQQINRALLLSPPKKALGEYPKQPLASLTPLQCRLYYWNKGVLALRANQHKVALEASQELNKSTTREESMWWLTRAKILRGNCLDREKAVSLMKNHERFLRSSQGRVDLALANTQLFAAHFAGCLETPQQRLDLLESLPESIQQTNAMVATKALLCRSLGRDAPPLPGMLMADYYYDTQQDYKKAASMYQERMDDSLEARVGYIKALSHYDPKAAEAALTELEPRVETMDGQELEAREIPRIKSGAVLAAAVGTSVTKKKKKSREAIMRRRARKRDAYLEGKHTRLDPERWIPKHERSNRKNRGAKNTRGHQGGGISEKEASKLDVAARKDNNSGVRSTAHISVSSGKRKGGRRR